MKLNENYIKKVVYTLIALSLVTSCNEERIRGESTKSEPELMSIKDNQLRNALNGKMLIEATESKRLVVRFNQSVFEGNVALIESTSEKK